MLLPHLDHATQISDLLNVLAASLKARSRAGLTDANRISETVVGRFLNALFGWNLVSLNTEQINFPGADLGDRQRRIAIQVTNEEGSDKIKDTTTKIIEHQLGSNFDRLIIFFLLPRKPGFPKHFTQPLNGPTIETWDIADLLKQSQLSDLDALARAAKVLDEEMGKMSERHTPSPPDISRIVKYAPAELIGRDGELKLLYKAWHCRQLGAARTNVLTLVALGGEGKTSLVAKWTAELAHQGWQGCDTAFAWSFYSQGTRDQAAASSDLFLKEALIFFGDEADKKFAASSAGAFEKGQRLARIVGRRRNLLILDGLEPLQYAPTSPTPGQLKDQGIAALLKGLATASHGLCVVTTRYSLPDLKAFWQTTAPEVKLLRLSRDSGVLLLKTLGVRKESGTAREFETLIEDVKGHALTLTLLGGFLRRAFGGDIRKRDRVKFEQADRLTDGGHAFRTMAAYEQWLARDGGDEGRREVALLRLMGLFDRPADAGCLAALRNETIPGLTEPLVNLTEDEWEFCLTGLEVLTVNRAAAGELISLDAHPHLREYFAKQLREQSPAAWRMAHRRLYEHLCASTREGDEPTLETLQPLYQAMAHGCQAGLVQESHDDVHVKRVRRGDDYYSVRKLGAFGSDLGAIVWLFDVPWSVPSAGLTEYDRAVALGQAAFCLRALGRLIEAIEPMRATVPLMAKLEDWKQSAIAASNLSELELTLGDIVGAIGDAEQGVTYANRSDDWVERRDELTTLADALTQGGRWAEAAECFREAERVQADNQPACPQLYSLRGFRFCDLLLTSPERAAWRQTIVPDSQPSTLDEVESCRAVSRRSALTFKWAESTREDILSMPLDHLTLGRSALYEAILENSDFQMLTSVLSHIDAAVDGLRRAGTQQFLPLGLLTRAWIRFVIGVPTGTGSAREDLDEAWEIAERGPMKLFLADIHLHRARLFFRKTQYPWESPTADLDAAERLIDACGYHRRDEELADAKKAILGP